MGGRTGADLAIHQGMNSLRETRDRKNNIRIDMEVKTGVEKGVMIANNNQKRVMIVDRDVNMCQRTRTNNNHGDVLSICQRTNNNHGDVLSICQRTNNNHGDVLSICQRTNNNHGDVLSICQRTNNNHGDVLSISQRSNQKRFIMIVHRDLMSMSQRNNHRFIIVHNVSDQHGENRLFDLPEGQTGHLKVELNHIDPL
jgi:hypothetical protein